MKRGGIRTQLLLSAVGFAILLVLLSTIVASELPMASRQGRGDQTVPVVPSPRGQVATYGSPSYDANTGAISVLVLDGNSSAPVSGVSVFAWEKGTIGSANYSRSTDSAGYANLTYVPPGEYELWIVPVFKENYLTEWAYANVSTQHIINLTVYLQERPPIEPGGQGSATLDSTIIFIILIPILILAVIVRIYAESEKRKSPSPPSALGTCQRCGSSIATQNSSFCRNCAAILEEADTARVEAELDRKPIGTKCMICNFQLDTADELLWCPHCGHPAHKDHLLEWLHVKNRCPWCSQHLDEREVKRQLRKS